MHSIPATSKLHLSDLGSQNHQSQKAANHTATVAQNTEFESFCLNELNSTVLLKFSCKAKKILFVHSRHHLLLGALRHTCVTSPIVVTPLLLRYYGTILYVYCIIDKRLAILHISQT